jgi:F-type H+-transporting ATPase subunit delta
VSEAQVARVYAQALFDAAREAGRVDPVRRELGDFVAALAASASLRDVLADPRVDEGAKRRVLAELTHDAEPLVSNTLKLLQEKGRFDIVAGLHEELEAMVAAEAEVVEVEVISAVQLGPDAERRLAAKVAEATGRRVELTQKVDAGVLGGLVVRVGDVIVDGSLRSRIRQLRQRLVTAEVRGDAK